ncbi:MAG: TauD/TfdA family dioxygenase [Pseudomonadota bacterium]
MSSTEITVPLPDKCIDELDSLTAQLTSDNINNVNTSGLSACAEFATELRNILFDGIGVVVIDRLPVERYNTDQSRRLAGVMANMISPLMAQDVNDTYLYDVIDAAGQSKSEAEKKAFTRRSKTNVSQPFHTDGPWFETPPHLVGLFCISPAAKGGLSQVSSLHEAVEQVQRKGTDAGTYHRAVAWNKMGEHKPTEPPTRDLPIVEPSAGATIMRHYADYVRTGFGLSDTEMPNAVDVLLADLDAALAKNACEPFKLEAGQFQYINNWALAHARAGFNDDPAANSGRHLVRLWNHSPIAEQCGMEQEQRQQQVPEPALAHS